jgi:hypothetical protein
LIPLIWISTIVWVLLLVVSLLRISRKKPIDTGWLRANILAIVAYSIMAAVATQTAGNALWFATFGEPYPGESLESLRFATLLGALVMITVALVTVWDNLRTIPKDKGEALAAGSGRIGQEIQASARRQEIKENRVKDAIAGTQVLLPLLKNFMNHWEQYQRLSLNERSQSRHRTQVEATGTSAQLLNIDSRYSDSWDSALRNQVQILSDQLRKFGNAQITVAGPIDWESMEEKGRDAYTKTRALLSYIMTHNAS